MLSPAKIGKLPVQELTPNIYETNEALRKNIKYE